MDAAHIRQRKQTPANPRLIGHNEQFETGLAETVQGLPNPGKEGNLIRTREILHFLDQCPITIKKHGAVQIQAHNIRQSILEWKIEISDYAAISVFSATACKTADEWLIGPAGNRRWRRFWT
jgi:hypothetical protein